MPARPNKRRPPKSKSREVVSADAIAKLYDIGPYDRNQVSLLQINRVRDIIELEGLPRACELIGVCDVTLLRVTSGFAHKLRPDTAARVRKFFGTSK